ncbi:rhomboid family intramembrane serine protease [Carboxylicivirga sediminis]|uniref:Rhomboid family intramembrane serine protease n=1 Tax=Carboxylicivirga sediminis TaxID=2006564 RepID=A0A941F5A4_9BACT|nr:rhomboid family intramembrane serine protease [Carboxylicivirga sediminis]MBR8535960.1 rhomboid family intramembrane serine protease [Carboxylicivirga sediminis]
MNIAIIIIIVICLISIAGFSQPELIYKYQFNAWQIKHRKEYLRWISHGFFHGSWMHLLINMFVLWSFSRAVLFYFMRSLPGNSNIVFLLFFFSAIVVSSIYSYLKEKDNYNYNAIGASGAVSAVVFASILYDPFRIIYLYFIPVPGILLGIGYLIYSRVMSQRNTDNIGHDAHFWGAVYGFVFPILLNPSLLSRFFNELISIF